MADVRENATSGMLTQRLRTLDPSYLRGAIRPSGAMPEPIAIATGPNGMVGPAAGAVGGNEAWSLSVTVGSMPDVCWVLVRADYQVNKTAGASSPIASYIWPYGSLTDGAAVRPPVLGLGLNLDAVEVASGGTYVTQVIPPTTDGSGRSLWIPFDPELTKDGFDIIVHHTAAAGGLAVDSLSLNLDGIIFIGYPSNVWGTSALWAPQADRGS